MERATVSDGDRGLLLIGEHRAAGAVFGPDGENAPPRHYGDPAAEYAAATSGAVVVDRSGRGRFRVTGRAPAQMLEGILTARVPAAPTSHHGAAVGQGVYSAMLTSKGRMITDLRVFRLGGASEQLLLDVPGAGVRPLVDHLERSLPPRLARLEDVSADSGMVSVVGPAALDAVAAPGTGPLPGADAGGLTEALAGLGTALEYLWSGDAGSWVLVVGGDHGGMAAVDILGDPGTVQAWWAGLLATGVKPAGHGVFETLRVEGGQPAFGVDMDDDTIPPEAGIEDRAIDHRKGCYTGQEVIVRIRDRGHVNRHLRGLLFGDAPTPAPGTPLFEEGEGRSRGYVTSAVFSPRLRQVIGLGYVRREVEPPTVVRLGSPDGPPVTVRSLDSGWGPSRG